MNFLSLKQRLARRVGANDTTLDTLWSARAGDFLNEAHRAILRMPGMEPLRYGLVTFASVVGQQAYALPTEGVARINRVWETTNQRKLVYRTMDWLRTSDPAPVQGTPCYYIPVGYVEVQQQPTAATALYVKSSSAGDTTQVAYVEGILSDGTYRSVSVTLTGTTAVTLSSTVVTFVQVTKFYVSAACAGTVTLLAPTATSGVSIWASGVWVVGVWASGVWGTSGASTSLSALAAITIGKTRAQYYGLLLESLPSAVTTYTCDVLRGIPDMSNPTDEPLLPADFHDILIDGAILKEFVKGDDARRFAATEKSYKAALADLRTFVTAHPDWRPTFGTPEQEFSSLGAWFPAGS